MRLYTMKYTCKCGHVMTLKPSYCHICKEKLY